MKRVWLGVAFAAVGVVTSCGATVQVGPGGWGPGFRCNVASECASRKCISGECVGLGNGESCSIMTQCGSETCTSGVCAYPSCSPHCTDGQACGSTADCKSGTCMPTGCSR